MTFIFIAVLIAAMCICCYKNKKLRPLFVVVYFIAAGMVIWVSYDGYSSIKRSDMKDRTYSLSRADEQIKYLFIEMPFAGERVTNGIQDKIREYRQSVTANKILHRFDAVNVKVKAKDNLNFLRYCLDVTGDLYDIDVNIEETARTKEYKGVTVKKEITNGESVYKIEDLTLEANNGIKENSNELDPYVNEKVDITIVYNYIDETGCGVANYAILNAKIVE